MSAFVASGGRAARQKLTARPLKKCFHQSGGAFKGAPLNRALWGAPLDANELLSRTRLSLEALTRLHVRHFAPLPEDRLLQLTAPLHSRTRRGSVTITASIAGASLPDAAADPALRRLTSPQRPVLRTAIARGNPGGPPPVSPRVGLVARLASTAGDLPVDPTDFVPHGLMGIPAKASVVFDPNADAVDLTGIGMPVAVPTALVTQVRNDTATVTADPHPRITRRPDLMSGVLGERHLQEARDLREQVGSPWYSVYDLLSLVTPTQRITDPPRSSSAARRRTSSRWAWGRSASR